MLGWKKGYQKKNYICISLRINFFQYFLYICVCFFPGQSSKHSEGTDHIGIFTSFSLCIYPHVCHSTNEKKHVTPSCDATVDSDGFFLTITNAGGFLFVTVWFITFGDTGYFLVPFPGIRVNYDLSWFMIFGCLYFASLVIKGLWTLPGHACFPNDEMQVFPSLLEVLATRWYSRSLDELIPPAVLICYSYANCTLFSSVKQL